MHLKCCSVVMEQSTVQNLPTYLPTYLPTPRCTVLEKLSGSQLVKKFPVMYVTQRFITTFTSVRHLSLSRASSIQSIPPHSTSWRHILMLSSQLRLRLPSRQIFRLKMQWIFHQHKSPTQFQFSHPLIPSSASTGSLPSHVYIAYVFYVNVTIM